MGKNIQRFYLIATSAVAGFAANTAAVAFGRGDYADSSFGCGLTIALLLASIFIARKVVK